MPDSFSYLFFSPSPVSLFPFTGYTETSSAGCKQYTVGFTTLEDKGSTATADISVNGMDAPEMVFSPAESTTGTPGQSHCHMIKMTK